MFNDPEVPDFVTNHKVDAPLAEITCGVCKKKHVIPVDQKSKRCSCKCYIFNPYYLGNIDQSVPCEYCDGTGFILGVATLNNHIYTTASRCGCENSDKFSDKIPALPREENGMEMKFHEQREFLLSIIKNKIKDSQK